MTDPGADRPRHEARLAALHATSLLDSPPEEAFDRLLRLFVHAVDAPIALLTLVDRDRQFFKSAVGLPASWAGVRESPLTHSFCRHVVDAGAPLAVPDLRAHPSLRHNPAVEEMGVAAYAGVPVVDGAGEVLGAVAVLDTRARPWSGRDLALLDELRGAVQRELALRAELARGRDVARRLRMFEKVMDTMQLGVTVADTEGRIVYANRADAALHGYTVEEMVGEHSSLLGAPELAGDPPRDPGWERWHRESVNVRRDGSRFPVELWSDLVRGEDGEPEAVVTCCHELTDRDRTAAELRASEERFRLLVEEVQDYSIILLDPDGRIASWNRGAERLHGYTAEEALGHTLTALYTADDRADGVPARLLRDAAASGRAMVEGWRVRRDGTRFWAEVVVTALRGPGGALTGFAKITRDVTEIRASAEAARRSEARLSGIIESAMDAIVSVDAEQRVVVFNAAAERMFGTPAAEAKGAPLSRFIPPRHRDAHAAHVARFGRTGVTTRSMMHPAGGLTGLRADGSEFPLEAAISQVEADGEKLLTAIVRDVTERRSTEEALRLSEAQLQQAQKMESVGRLAGGVAHDFNNLLMVIRGFATLMERASPDLPADRAYLAEIQRAAERATALTQQLLAFGRKQAQQPRVLDLGEVVEGAAAMLRRLVREDVEMVHRRAPDTWPVRADPHQLEQVLVNLVVNARDAIHGAGRVEVEVANRVVRAGGTVPAGRYVALTARDTGCGMDAATLGHVFEPFFTTKPVGEGTGLGLATVYGIVQQSGGHVWAESSPGLGTEFTVLLPALDEACVPAPPAEPRGRLVRGAGTVLLVEDDAAVRGLLALVLRDAGYHVVEAEDGEAALHAAPGMADIDVLVTDTVMPRVGGPELARRLRAERPGVRVVLMSGYAGDALPSLSALPRDWDFLQKPVDPATLLLRLHERLAT